MLKQPVHTDKAPAALGPYSQGVICGDLLFVSGQLGADEEGNLPDSVTEQAEWSLRNLSSIVQAAGSSMEKVVKCQVFLTDMGDFAAVNQVYAQFFPVPCPARSCIQVCALPKGAKVEIEAIAQI
ncbi:MAG: RidA family protein [Clostridiales bacterium]|nr:RidA family protein [Clostridiales bacterium]